MTFPNQDSLTGTIADLKEILSRSHSDNHECKLLLGQIESIVQDIQKKTRPAQVTNVVAIQSTAPVSF